VLTIPNGHDIITKLTRSRPPKTAEK